MEINSITKKLLFNTIRVDTVLEDGSSGSGTAFIVNHPYNGRNHTFVVTNKHLVEGVRSGGLQFTQKKHGNPEYGNGFTLDINDFSHAWFGHPDETVDIAVIPLRPLESHINSLGVDIYYHVIETTLIPDANATRSLDALETVIFVGYPSGVWDQTNLIPILRKGTTATPIPLDFEGRKEFLIDAAVYPGSSGSPVFIYNGDQNLGRYSGTVTGKRFLFVGVVAAVFFKEEANQLVPAPIPASNVPAMSCSEMIDLGLVIKSQAVVEAIEAYIREAGL